ncbi:hypothetical protein XENTR_v10017651 [Xenopus tropicalis]|nr:hypothetical protein XENTR_v10017651 [Xenopus tropicalis]
MGPVVHITYTYQSCLLSMMQEPLFDETLKGRRSISLIRQPQSSVCKAKQWKRSEHKSAVNISGTNCPRIL